MRIALRLVRTLTLIVLCCHLISGLSPSPSNRSLPFQATVAQAATLPDLQPVSFTLTRDGPLYTNPTYTATFTSRNVGSVPASGVWVDQV